MARVIDQKELLQNAAEAFQRTTGVKAVIEWARTNIDAEMRIAKGDREWRFHVEVKPWLTTAGVGLLAHQLRQPREWIVVTRQANPALAEMMRDLRIQFIDTAGNAFLDAEDFVVYVKGQRHPATVTPAEMGRPFKPAGMQVIFALICNPGLERETYRVIAAAAKTALGTINWTMRDLRTIAHLADMGRRGRRIIKKEALFEKWVAAYPQQLRPKQFVGRYTALEPTWLQTADLAQHDAFWGGEKAAAIQTGYLKPEVATIYVAGNLNDLLLRNKLKKDPHGKIEIFRKFWGFQWHEHAKGTVPLPLIYADLLATGIQRNIETAHQLREQKLDRYFREN